MSKRQSILQKTLNVGKNAKKERKLLSQAYKMMNKQDKLKRQVEDNLMGMGDTNELRKNYDIKNETEDSTDSNLFDQYKNNFQKKVKIWNINELKKVNSSLQREFYKSLK